MKQGITLIFCFLFFLIRGKTKKALSFPPKNILIFQGMKLGDMVCTTPMFRAIKDTYPACRVTIAGNAINRELLVGNKDVDKYLILEKGVFDNCRMFRKEKFDFACLVGTNFSSLASLYLSGIPLITAQKVENGWSPYETRSYKILRKLVGVVPYKMKEYAPQEYLKLLEPAGIHSDETKKHLAFTSESDSVVKSFFKEHGIDERDFIVGISPSAGNKVKKWGEEKFAVVADYLSENYNAKVIIIGGKNDMEETAKMMQFVKSRVINASERFSIDELKALISQMRLFISVDTGPVYIAEAFGIPTIDITGPIDENEQPPIGELHKVVVPLNRTAPELFVMNARVYNKEEALRQSESITVKMVTDTIDDLCAKLGYHKKK